jgi:heme-degrading monooxygenase HmoA
MIKDHTPYYAVIFTSTHTEDINGYAEMSNQMENLAKQQDGFLGIESAKNEVGITVSYWESLKAIKNWKQQTDHLIVQQKGRKDWYSWYKVRICKVEREYEFAKSTNA